MIYVYLGLFIVALWGVSLIALSRPGELSAVERCDLLSEFGGHLHWLEAIGHMPANELNEICSTSRRSGEMNDDAIGSLHSPGGIASLISGKDYYPGAYAT